MTLHRCIRVCSLAALLLIFPAGVFAQDVDAMAKWTALTVVHYRVVGEYAAESQFLKGALSSASANATDRVELEFDWDQFEMKLAGAATIRNSATQFVPIQRSGCPPLRVNGALEIATAVSAKDGPAPGMVVVALKRDHPAGQIPLSPDGMPCGTEWETAAATSATAEKMLQVLPAMMLAMGPNPGMVTADGKSMFVKGEGWTWTFTPTPVR